MTRVQRIFPHTCPGVGCAICAWVARRDVEVAYRDGDPVTRATARQRLLRRSYTTGRTWPELVAEKLP